VYICYCSEEGEPESESCSGPFRKAGSQTYTYNFGRRRKGSSPVCGELPHNLGLIEGGRKVASCNKIKIKVKL